MIESIETSRRLDTIEFNLKAYVVCSNINRAGIIYLLNCSDENEMQAEKIAASLGISHRTALYHLDILQDLGVVEVRKFRKKGENMNRSVWGLNERNGNLEMILMRISTKFPTRDLEKRITRNLSDATKRI